MLFSLVGVGLCWTFSFLLFFCFFFVLDEVLSFFVSLDCWVWFLLEDKKSWFGYTMVRC